MREAGLVVGETLELLRDGGRARASPRPSSTRSRPRTHPAQRRDPELPRTTTASRPRSARRSTTRSCTASPATGCCSEGDLISIDCGAIIEGWHGDAAITVARRRGRPTSSQTLMRDVRGERCGAGLAAARLGGRLTDISHAIETYVRSQGDYGIVEDYVGHGIGSAMHMPPNVPNYGRAGRGPKLVEGMALAVEPMITLGHDRDQRARRRLDGRHRRRIVVGTLRALVHLDAQGRARAHRPRRRSRQARRTRYPLRRLTRVRRVVRMWPARTGG